MKRSLLMMRSLLSMQECYVAFVNTTNRSLDIIWIDYNGGEKFHMELEPRATANVNTFRTHPWIFRDKVTGERMHVANKACYLPQPCFIRIGNGPRDVKPVRQQIFIHFPLRTLRDSSLWQIMTSLLKAGNANGTESTNAAIDTLELPEVLKHDLNTLRLTTDDFSKYMNPEALFR